MIELPHNISAAYLGLLGQYAPEAAKGLALGCLPIGPEQARINVVIAQPQACTDVIFYLPGFGRNFAQDVPRLVPRLQRGFGFVYFEMFGMSPGASPYRHSNKQTRGVHSMVAAFLLALRTENLTRLFFDRRTGFPAFGAARVFLEADSMGASTLLGALGSGTPVLKYGDQTKPFQAMALTGPRLNGRLGVKHSHWTERAGPLILSCWLAAGLEGWIPGWMKRSLAVPTVELGVPKQGPVRTHMEMIGDTDYRLRQIPLTLADDVTHFDRQLRKLLGQKKLAKPRTVWTLGTKDKVVDTRLAYRYAVHQESEGDRLIQAEHHDPFWKDPDYQLAVEAFFRGQTHERLWLLNDQRALETFS